MRDIVIDVLNALFITRFIVYVEFNLHNRLVRNKFNLLVLFPTSPFMLQNLFIYLVSNEKEWKIYW